MGRGPKSPKRKVEAKPPVTSKSPNNGARIRDREKRLAEALKLKVEALERERATGQALTKALDQQAATSEILRVISSSPTDIQPVFDIIAASAARLCAARDAQALRLDGDVLRLISAYGSPSMSSVRTIGRGHAVGLAVIDRQTIHVRDMAQAVADFPETPSPQHGVESLLAVPLLRGDVAVGVIRVSRTQIQPFTEQQITLLKTFADQAVIAIENVRLFKELETSSTPSLRVPCNCAIRDTGPCSASMEISCILQHTTISRRSGWNIHARSIRCVNAP
jgi:GAF domain-containing protein